ncbi:alanine racemase [Massarina eburnea CBS 473.64]|uniref:Alanine racemase n=1 Tax=Massarina eburnea CBS 473.64 TaxID=1395130 RepID=A0A6A6RRS1_9PLEO|nr:alanine racemase [Massarina eburnea CBS 473.64]
MDVPQRSVPHIDELRNFYVGKDINDVPKPAVVLDRAKMRRHCQSLSEAVDSLGVNFRAHVKTHKTGEGVRIQAGKSGKDIKLVASTIAEFEFLLPVLKEFKDNGRAVNMLYGIPLPPSQVSRLAAVGRQLGPGSISVLIDNVAQLTHLTRFYDEAGFAAGVYLKVDTGYHRAGLPPSQLNKSDLISESMGLEQKGKAYFIGLYSHSSLSYNDSTQKQAMANLEGEIDGCLEALRLNAHLFPKEKEITVSVGASPQVTAIENLVSSDGTLSDDAEHLRQTILRVMNGDPDGFRTKLELHAGVYSILDVQQLSTKSRARLGDDEDEIAISVVAEVCSVYNKNEREQPEALVAVGVLGLGREPCVSYKGWGIIDRNAYSPDSKPDRRLVVERISQEHCIVSWESDEGRRDGLPIPLEVGQTVRIYPNHACITGALYGWYLVVDEEEGQNGTRVVDVWVRAGGW